VELYGYYSARSDISLPLIVQSLRYYPLH